MIDTKNLAFALKFARGGKSLDVVAEEVGLTKATLSRIERRKVYPDLDTYTALCKWMKVSLDTFLLDEALAA